MKFPLFSYTSPHFCAVLKSHFKLNVRLNQPISVLVASHRNRDKFTMPKFYLGILWQIHIQTSNKWIRCFAHSLGPILFTHSVPFNELWPMLIHPFMAIAIISKQNNNYPFSGCYVFVVGKFDHGNYTFSQHYKIKQMFAPPAQCQYMIKSLVFRILALSPPLCLSVSRQHAQIKTHLTTVQGSCILMSSKISVSLT